MRVDRSPRRRITRIAASTAATLICTAPAVGQTMVSFDLSGVDADGYLATVNLNQEGNQTLDNIDRNPGNAKFYDYPAFVNPDQPDNIYIMYVEPYRFGLDYPDPLYPDENGVLVSVAPLRPIEDAGLPDTTFIDAATEDADFSIFNVGSIEFDADAVSTVGVDVVVPEDLTITLDGTEFQSTNRVELLPGADAPPFGPEGRSNRNEAANIVSITQTGASGSGLTFTDGVLTEIALTLGVDVEARGVAFPAGFGLVASGTMTITGDQLEFHVDDLSELPGIASDVRLILNRRGTVDAVNVFSLAPAECPCDVNNDTRCSDSDFFAWVTAFVADPRTPEQEDACDVNRDGNCSDSDFFAWVTEFIGPGCS